MPRKKSVKKVKQVRKTRKVTAPKKDVCELYGAVHMWRMTWNPDNSKSKSCDCGALESL